MTEITHLQYACLLISKRRRCWLYLTSVYTALSFLCKAPGATSCSQLSQSSSELPLQTTVIRPITFPGSFRPCLFISILGGLGGIWGKRSVNRVVIQGCLLTSSTLDHRVFNSEICLVLYGSSTLADLEHTRLIKKRHHYLGRVYYRPYFYLSALIDTRGRTFRTSVSKKECIAHGKRRTIG